MNLVIGQKPSNHSKYLEPLFGTKGSLKSSLCARARVCVCVCVGGGGGEWGANCDSVLTQQIAGKKKKKKDLLFAIQEQNPNLE